MRRFQRIVPLLLAGVAAIAPQALAQGSLNTRFSGYYEHQYSLSRANDEWRQLDHDRLRAELDIRTRQGSRASASVVYQLYRGDTDIDASDYLPQGLLPGTDSLGTTLEDRHYVNHAYAALVLSSILELTVGKQYLTWGAGWVFNPTELFRPKNALEPSYDREGVGALSLQIVLGPLSDALVAFVPDGDLEQSGKIVRLRHHVAGFDVSAVGAIKTEGGINGLPFRSERRYILGGDVTGEILGLGVWAEGTYSEIDGTTWGEMTVGGNYSLRDGTLLMAEAYFNGRGKSDSPYPAQAWLGRLAGDRLTLGEATLFGMVSRPFGNFWTVGLSTIANPGDGSAVVVPSIAYSFADNIDLLFNGIWYLGESGDEYGFDQVGGFIRGRVYF